MNQRIQELIVIANDGLDGVRPGSQPMIDPSFSKFIERFAELIVQECAAYLNGAMEVHNQRDQDLMDLAARKIKQHLGVE